MSEKAALTIIIFFTQKKKQTIYKLKENETCLNPVTYITCAQFFKIQDILGDIFYQIMNYSLANEKYVFAGSLDVVRYKCFI